MANKSKKRRKKISPQGARTMKPPTKEEEDEGWTYFIKTSKGVYPLSVLKSAEIRKQDKPKSKQLKSEQDYLTQNDLMPLPFEASTFLLLKDNCSYFDACVKQIAKDVIGQGYKIVLREGKKESPEEKKRIEKFLEESGGDRDETFMDTLERGLIDWGVIGWWGWEISRSDTGKNKGLVDAMWHVPAQTIRVHKDHEKFCQVRMDKELWFKKFGVEGDIDSKDGKPIGEEGGDKAHEMIFYRNYYPQSDYYGAPNIYSATGAVIGHIGVRDFNLAFFENYGIPAALIVLKGRWSKDSAKQISDFLDVEIKSSENAHKTMIIHPQRESKLEYIKLGIEVKEGSFKLYFKQQRDEILAVNKMPAYRIGVVETGSLGGNVAQESTKIYVQSVITPLEMTIERLVSDSIFREGLKIENYRFELNELDLRDKSADVDMYLKLFGIGAITSNQILVAEGRSDLQYPEGNKYFINSQFLEIGEEPVKKYDEQLYELHKAGHLKREKMVELRDGLNKVLRRKK